MNKEEMTRHKIKRSNVILSLEVLWFSLDPNHTNYEVDGGLLDDCESHRATTLIYHCDLGSG